MPASRFFSGSKGRRQQYSWATTGMICISPIAPLDETARLSQLDSTCTTARASRRLSPTRAATRSTSSRTATSESRGPDADGRGGQRLEGKRLGVGHLVRQDLGDEVLGGLHFPAAPELQDRPMSPSKRTDSTEITRPLVILTRSAQASGGSHRNRANARIPQQAVRGDLHMRMGDPSDGLRRPYPSRLIALVIGPRRMRDRPGSQLPDVLPPARAACSARTSGRRRPAARPCSAVPAGPPTRGCASAPARRCRPQRLDRPGCRNRR